MHDDSPDRSAEPQTREVSMLSQVSNEMVKLYKDHSVSSCSSCIPRATTAPRARTASKRRQTPPVSPLTVRPRWAAMLAGVFLRLTVL